MTTPISCAESVAARLTEAQRAWLIVPGYVDPNTIRSLRRRGILHAHQRGLTEVGQAVRSYLVSSPITSEQPA